MADMCIPVSSTDYSRSSTSPLNCSSPSDDSVQSAGAMWITQLRRFRPFALELAAVDYP